MGEKLKDFNKLIHSAQNGDKEAFEEIVYNNSTLIHYVLKKYKKLDSQDYKDFFQTGALGLVKAIKKFDTSKGFAFSTYAYAMIEGEIKRYIRDYHSNIVRFPRSTKELHYKVKEFISKGLSMEEIAEEIEIPVEKVRDYYLYKSPYVSLDSSFNINNDSEKKEFYSIFKDERDEYSDVNLYKDLQNILNERELLIYEMFYVYGYYQSEIGSVINKTQATVSRELSNINHKIKEYFNKGKTVPNYSRKSNRICKEDVENVLSLNKEGKRVVEISNILKISTTTIYKILKRREKFEVSI